MLDAYQDLIEGLTEESNTLRQLLGDPVPDDLDPEVLALLKEARAREGAMRARTQKIMRGENVNLRSMENEPAVRNSADMEGTPEEILQAFILDRGEVVSLLINLTLKDWERKVPHWVSGETTIAEEVEEHLAWEDEALDKFEASLG